MIICICSGANRKTAYAILVSQFPHKFLPLRNVISSMSKMLYCQGYNFTSQILQTIAWVYVPLCRALRCKIVLWERLCFSFWYNEIDLENYKRKAQNVIKAPLYIKRSTWEKAMTQYILNLINNNCCLYYFLR